MNLFLLSTFFGLLILISCSREAEKRSSSDNSSGVTVHQVKAKELIAPDLKRLQDNQYQISSEDLSILQEENLLTKEEAHSLSLVK